MAYEPYHFDIFHDDLSALYFITLMITVRGQYQGATISLLKISISWSMTGHPLTKSSDKDCDDLSIDSITLMMTGCVLEGATVSSKI